MSHPLVEELKREHVLVATRLQEAKELGVHTLAGRSALKKAKTVLLAHLRKEDERLYPTLRVAAMADARLGWMLDVYGRDMEDISGAALAFFERLERGEEEEGDLTGAFGTLLARLRERIANEEHELYREYERIQKGVPG